MTAVRAAAWMAALLALVSAPLVAGLGASPLAHLPAAPAPPLVDADADVPYDCPPSDPVSALQPGCPVRLHVPGHVLGRPVLAMNPANPTQLVVAALGGTPAGAPTSTSRANATIFVFLSDNAGATFQRIAVDPPQPDLLGEDVALVADAHGNLVLAALFSKAADPAPTIVAAWKPGTFDDAGKAWPAPEVFAPWAAAASVERISLVAVPDADEVVLLWDEVGVAPDDRAPLGPGGFIRHARGPGDPAAPWALGTDEQTMGPCRQLSNALAWKEKAYFGCAAETGLWPARNLTAGRLVFASLDARNGSVAYRSKLPLQGQPVLASLRDGRFALVVTELVNPDEVRVVYTTALQAANWTGPRRLGTDLHNSTTDPSLKDARILGMAAHRTSGLVWMLYGEVPATPPSGPDAPLQPRQAKYMISASSVGGFISKESLGVDDAQGRLLRSLGPGAAQALSAPFPQDGRDALLAFGTRDLVAYADAGDVVVSELVGPVVPLEAPPLPEQISETPTALSNLPPRPFTPAFLGVGVVLAAGMLFRVLYGRVDIKVKHHESWERK